MKKTGSFFFAFILTAFAAFSEGSKELCATGGYRAFLVAQNNGNLSYPFPTPGTMKVYVRAGETICAGSSAQGFNAGTIRLRAPDGSVYTSGNSATVGLIANRAQEIAGPLPNAGGYTPYTRLVTSGQEGVWEIDFISESNGAASSGNPAPLPASAAWAQPAGQFIAAFDISVRNQANTAFLTGRVFTNIFSGILGTFDVGFNAVFRILTKDGYQYTLDNNGQAGNGFSFFANNKGFRTPGGAPSYLSVDDLAAPNIQDPRSADTESDITHKIFFNSPATDLPALAAVPGGGLTWLLTTPQVASLANLTFTGVEGTANRAGTFPLGANIGFTTNQNGTFQVSIDINNNGVYTDGIDRTITGNGKSGVNSVYWDGLDGQGNKVGANAGVLTVGISVVLFGGEVHFPFFDVERNTNGIVLTRLNGPPSNPNTVYWDDTPLTLIAGTPSNPRKNTTGLNSTVNGHTWGSPGAGAVDFGDENGIDTWGYIIADPLVASVSFALREADLQVVSLTANADCASQKITWVATVKNNGPNAVQSASFRFAFPASVTGLSTSTTTLSGTASLSAAVTTTTQYSANLAMSNGAVMSFTFSGTVGGLGNATLAAMASMLRETDVTDPDASNPDGAIPVDPQVECDAAPSGSGCNNIISLNTIFPGQANAGPDQVISLNQHATLAANGTGAWTPASSNPLPVEILEPGKSTTIVNGFKSTGRYAFIWTNAAGCVDTIFVDVAAGTAETRMPNIITPNGDGKNEVFEILGLSAFPGSKLSVVNRWGNEVFRSDDYKNSWNGDGLAEGTYYYVFHRRESSGKFTVFRGWVFLRRE